MLIHIFQVVVIPRKPDVAQIFNPNLVGAIFPKPIALEIGPVGIAAVGNVVRNVVRNVVMVWLFKRVLVNTQFGSIESLSMKYSASLTKKMMRKAGFKSLKKSHFLIFRLPLFSQETTLSAKSMCHELTRECKRGRVCWSEE